MSALISFRKRDFSCEPQQIPIDYYNMQRKKGNERRGEAAKGGLRVLAIGMHSLKGVYPDRPERVNQDCASYRNLQGGCLAAVADGHGYYGEYASQFIIGQLAQTSSGDLDKPEKLFFNIIEHNVFLYPRAN